MLMSFRKNNHNNKHYRHPPKNTLQVTGMEVEFTTCLVFGLISWSSQSKSGPFFHLRNDDILAPRVHQKDDIIHL